MASTATDARILAHPPESSAPGDAVVLADVHKTFDRVPALAGLSLAIPVGSVTVLLGPNGAGKTTAIRAITGALPVDAGAVRTFGLDPVVDGEAVRRRCGVVSAKPALYDRMSGRHNLAYSAALYGVTDGVDDRIVAAADRFDIAHALGQTVGGYSTGMKTRLALARALLHEPDLLLLDEPTSGLDPESAHAVLAMIRDLADSGITVAMCTHLLVEAEGLADQIVMLDGGASLLAGSQDDLIDRYWPTPVVHLETIGPLDHDRLTAMPAVTRVTPHRSGGVLVELSHSERVPDLVDRLVATGARISRVQPHRPTLEALYFRVRADHRAGRAEMPRR